MCHRHRFAHARVHDCTHVPTEPHRSGGGGGALIHSGPVMGSEYCNESCPLAENVSHPTDVEARGFWAAEFGVGATVLMATMTMMLPQGGRTNARFGVGGWICLAGKMAGTNAQIIWRSTAYVFAVFACVRVVAAPERKFPYRRSGDGCSA